MALKHSEFPAAWELFSAEDFHSVIDNVFDYAKVGNLEALSILALTYLELGSWEDGDACIIDAGRNGGIKYWEQFRSELPHEYTALIARHDALQDIASNSYSHLEIFMMTIQHLSNWKESTSFYNTVYCMRILFASSEVKQQIDLLGANIFSWVTELKKRNMLEDGKLDELLDFINWTVTCAFDRKFAKELMDDYISNWESND